MKRDYNRVEAVVMYHEYDTVKFKEVNCNMDDLRYTQLNGVEVRIIYDEFGNRISRIVGNGIRFDMEYDDHNTITKLSMFEDHKCTTTINYLNTYENDNLIAQVSSNMEKEYFQYNQYGDCVFCMFAFNDNCDIITFYEYDYVNNIIVVKNIYNDTEKVHTRIRYLNLFKYRYGICEVIEN